MTAKLTISGGELHVAPPSIPREDISAQLGNEWMEHCFVRRRPYLSGTADKLIGNAFEHHKIRAHPGRLEAQ